MQRPSTFYLIIICSTICFILSQTTVSAQKKKKQTSTASQSINLTNADRSTLYRIVIPAAASTHEKKAAEVLTDHLLQMSGSALPVVADHTPVAKYEVVLGQSNRLNSEETGTDLNSLGDDGFHIKTVNDKLYITGGLGKGTLYGVYTFLEKYLGCRMYSPTVKVIPKMKEIVVPDINDLQIPKITFRSIHYRATWHEEYINWHKLNQYTNGERPNWGMWVHTFHALAPPDQYFNDHPEYFAEVNGKRLPTQLCLTHPEVLEIVVQGLRARMAQAPEMEYWSVSQNDNRNYCTCKNCKAIDDREGSPSGSIINFVNQVADRFPDKMISTLAYEYGRRAPATLKPRDNVNIMLCSIEAGRGKTIEEDPESSDFVEDVKDWGKIAKDIIVWDYVIQFSNLYGPFPNFHVLQPNLKFFADNGVTAMFEQGNREVGGEFAELRSYMISKLMWDPYADANAIMDDFLHGYYGTAAPQIRAYIDKITAELQKSGQRLGIFDGPNTAITSYLSPELVSEYSAIFDKAEKAVANNPELLERVREARLPLEFTIMEHAKKIYAGEGGVFQKVDGKWEPNNDIQKDRPFCRPAKT